LGTRIQECMACPRGKTRGETLLGGCFRAFHLGHHFLNSHNRCGRYKSNVPLLSLTVCIKPNDHSTSSGLAFWGHSSHSRVQVKKIVLLQYWKFTRAWIHLLNLRMLVSTCHNLGPKWIHNLISDLNCFFWL
jgi:hypothetical protein